MTIKTNFAAAVLVLAAVIAPAHAAELRPVKQVDVRMIDLATAQGVSFAQAKIRQAAKSVCAADGDATLADRNDQRSCTKAAIAQGYAKVGMLHTAQLSAKGDRLASK